MELPWMWISKCKPAGKGPWRQNQWARQQADAQVDWLGVPRPRCSFPSLDCAPTSFDPQYDRDPNKVKRCIPSLGPGQSPSTWRWPSSDDDQWLLFLARRLILKSVSETPPPH